MFYISENVFFYLVLSFIFEKQDNNQRRELYRLINGLKLRLAIESLWCCSLLYYSKNGVHNISARIDTLGEKKEVQNRD